MTKLNKLLAKIPEEAETLRNQFLDFLSLIRGLPKDKRFYVYEYYCPITNKPFYYGKGCGKRAWNHLMDYDSQNSPQTIKNKTIRNLIETHKTYPIITIIHHNLSEDDAYEYEKFYIDTHGKIIDGGILSNVTDGGNHFVSTTELSAIGGRIGGTICKNSKKGIFSDEYDIGAQSRLNWENGALDHIDFSTNGKKGGALVVSSGIGIHDPKYKDHRVEWAKLGATALMKTEAGIQGFTNPEWRADKLITDPDYFMRNASNAGKIGGKVTGSMFWWNDGKVNKKSKEHPGEPWVRGMLMSEKKRAQVYGKLAGNNRVKKELL
jgi:hypothetical protein